MAVKTGAKCQCHIEVVDRKRSGQGTSQKQCGRREIDQREAGTCDKGRGGEKTANREGVRANVRGMGSGRG